MNPDEAQLNNGGLNRSQNLTQVMLQQALRQGYYFRDITKTGYVTLTSAAEQAVMAAESSKFLDLMMISGATSSTNAILVNIYAGAGGSVIDSILIPATSVLGNMWHKYDIPLMASEPGQSWYAKTNDTDISNTTITISMVAIKNVR